MHSNALLNNGLKMPFIGLGVFRTKSGEECRSSVRTAFEYGYRMVDTARIYCNEKSVGRGLKDAALPRQDYFVTTKLWKDDFSNPREGLLKSLERLQLDYVDLFLLHWPFKGYQDAYLVLEELQKEGLCKSIGVSNFKIHHLEALQEAGASVIPQVNQIETHPENAETQLVNYCRSKNIVVEAYSPLGGEGRLLINDPRIVSIADYLKVTPAQVILRWNIQRGIVVIPKSIKSERIFENYMLFNFELTLDQMDMINSINQDLRRAFDSDRIDQRPASTFPVIIEED